MSIEPLKRTPDNSLMITIKPSPNLRNLIHALGWIIVPQKQIQYGSGYIENKIPIYPIYPIFYLLKGD